MKTCLQGDRITSPLISREVQPSTTASYSECDESWYTYYRHGNELLLGTNTLAVELHFISLFQMNAASFDAYLQGLAATSATDSCFILPFSPHVSIDAFDASTTAEVVMDFHRGSFWSTDAFSTTLSITYDDMLAFRWRFTRRMAQVNMVRVSAFTNHATAPKEFIIEGVTVSGEAVIFGKYDELTWTTQSYAEFPFFLQRDNYKSFRVTATTTLSPLSINELQLLVCHSPDTVPFTYSPAFIVLYRYQKSIHIHPVNQGCRNCSISPELPSLFFDSTYCVIYGVPLEVSPDTMYTVTASHPFPAVTHINITVKECGRNEVEVVRRYGAKNAIYEWFRIVDLETTKSVLAVEAFGSQEEKKIVVERLCLDHALYRVEMGSAALDAWSEDSYLTLNLFLDAHQKQMILRTRFDRQTTFSASVEVNIEPSIRPDEEWFCLMPTEYPADWYGTATPSGWVLRLPGRFPEAVSHIQLFKKQFAVSADLLAASGAFEIGIVYEFGCVVYLNGVEVYRFHIGDGVIDNNTRATGSFDYTLFRTVSLPLFFKKRMLLREGENTIAIALFSLLPSQTHVVFDAYLRLFGSLTTDRVLDHRVQSSNLVKGAFVLDGCSATNALAAQKSTFRILFSHQRQETISRMALVSSLSKQNGSSDKRYTASSLSVEAKNEDDAEYTPLLFMDSVLFFDTSTRRDFFLPAIKPFSEYRITLSCDEDAGVSLMEWRLFTDKMNRESVTPTYPTTDVLVGEDVGTIIPASQGYSFFTAVTPLPRGLAMDAATGTVVGVLEEKANDAAYSVQCKRYDGTVTSLVLSLVTVECTPDHSIVHLSIRTDAYPQLLSFSIFGESSLPPVPSTSFSSFTLPYATYTFAYCLQQSVYHLLLRYDATKTIDFQRGYRLSADSGRIPLSTQSILYDDDSDDDSDGSNELMKTVKVITTTFSNQMPFAANRTLWAVLRVEEEVPAEWLQPSFSTVTWGFMHLEDIGTSSTITTLARIVLQAPRLATFSVLTVRAHFNGGIIVYYNGAVVARSNLPSSPSNATLADRNHAFATPMFIHIPLLYFSSSSDRVVFGVEHHRSFDAPSSQPPRLSFSGVWRAESCVLHYNTVDGVEVKPIESGRLEDLLDLSILTHAVLENNLDASFRWHYHIPESVFFNSVVLYTVYPVSTSWSIWVKTARNASWDHVDSWYQLSTKEDSVILLDTPQGLLGYSDYKITLDGINSRSELVALAEVSVATVRTEGQYCMALGDYPAVYNMRKSPGPCKDNYEGYSYRICRNGVFSDIFYDHCKQRPPADLLYPSSMVVIAHEVPMVPIRPTFTNTISRFYVEPGLPANLTINPKTGEISGTPLALQTARSYTVYGENDSGATFFMLLLTVRKGYCKALGVFPQIQVGQSYVYDCHNKGAFVGSLTRSCEAGEHDGEWSEEYGMCVSVMTLVVVAVVVSIVIITVVIALLFMRLRGKEAMDAIQVKPREMSNAFSSQRRRSVSHQNQKKHRRHDASREVVRASFEM